MVLTVSGTLSLPYPNYVELFGSIVIEFFFLCPISEMLSAILNPSFDNIFGILSQFMCKKSESFFLR